MKLIIKYMSYTSTINFFQLALKSYLHGSSNILPFRYGCNVIFTVHSFLQIQNQTALKNYLMNLMSAPLLLTDLFNRIT